MSLKEDHVYEFKKMVEDMRDLHARMKDVLRHAPERIRQQAEGYPLGWIENAIDGNCMFTLENITEALANEVWCPCDLDEAHAPEDCPLDADEFTDDEVTEIVKRVQARDRENGAVS